MTEQLTVVESKPVPSVRETRTKIVEFERILASAPGAHIGNNEELCPLKHSFADGIYVREIFIPSGILLTGRIHKHCHPNFLLQGDVSVFTECGGWERLKAPQSIISKAGTKRIVYTHTDTRWVTCHATNETNPENIEDRLTVGSFEELEALEMEALCR